MQTNNRQENGGGGVSGSSLLFLFVGTFRSEKYVKLQELACGKELA